MISLTDGTTTVALPPDLYWSDEFAWAPVQRNETRSLTGARIVQQGVAVGGRSITLQPDDEESSWLTRSALDQLFAWSNSPSVSLMLTLRGVNRAVEFRSIEAKPVVHFGDVEAGDYYLATLRFTET
jgi:hypothetical protein